jgi:tripartite ATP-independent transporter DctM subunit
VSWELVLVAFVGGLILLILTGMPVAFAFLTVSIFATTLFYGFDAGMSQMITSMPAMLGSFALVPIVLFIFMGELLYHAGLAGRTMDALSKVIGRIPGRLSVLTMAGGTTLSVLSGSAVATTSMLSSLLIPDMRERGYSKGMSAGPILGAGGLAMVMPPSAMAVLVGTIGNISIGRLLIGGIIPGLLLALIGVAYIIVRCWRDPSQAPAEDLARVGWGERSVVILRDIAPLGSVVVLIIGLIVLGIATPTEAAAFGVVGAYLLMLLYRRMNAKAMVDSVMGTVRISGMILLIMAAAAAYSQLMAVSGATRELLALATELPVSPMVIVIAMILMVIVMGSPLEQVSILLITLPVFVPVVIGLGYDPVWFGIIMLITMDLANLTPPLGLALYVVKGAAPDSFTFGDVSRAALPFIIVDLVVIALLLAVPELVTWLPDRLL